MRKLGGPRPQSAIGRRSSRAVSRFVATAVVVAVLLSALHAGALTPATPDETRDETPPDARIAALFLGGSSGSHRPQAMYERIASRLNGHGVELTYTASVDDLSDRGLAPYDVLIIFKDDGHLPDEARQALDRWLTAGGGLVAVHCASHAFRDSDWYTRLVGGRFLRHGSGEFRARIVDAQHPAMRGVASFRSWDETYIHNELADDLGVLMVRHEEGGDEPYTWVRRHGAGRVFYTALGHDERTWGHPDFARLLASAIRWSAAGATEAPNSPTGATRAPSAASAASAAPRGDAPAPAAAADAGSAAAAPSAAPSQPPGPLSPEESIKRMHLPEGLAVELFAAEPAIRNPLAIAFDAQGRLWVADSADYPNRVLPPGEGHDEIKILSDTNGDGRANHVQVFASGLNIPTAIAFGGGGVLVACAPDLLLLRDVDGDDVADERHVLYTGFGRRDTHAVLSNLWYGPDNWIWGTVGYSGGRIEVDGHQQRFSMGLFRCRADGSRFEFVTSTSNNTWGLGFTPAGDVVASTANRHHSWFLAIANRHFERVRGWHEVGSMYNADHARSHPLVGEPNQWDHQGSFTAACGATVYAADHLPAIYRDRAMLVCEPTIHLIHLNWLHPEGSHLVARDGWNLLASDDPWTAPVQTVVGPDGAVWFVDWYSPSVLHNKPDEPPADHGAGNAWLHNAHRDDQYARIYRIVARPPTGADDEGSHRAATEHARDDAGTTSEPVPSASPAALSADDPLALVAALGDANFFWRMTAQRMLVERGALDVVEHLAALVTEGAASPADAPPQTTTASLPASASHAARAARHALYTLDGLAAFERDQWLVARLLPAALAHHDAAVRRAALDVLPRSDAAIDWLLASGVLDDRDAFVRRDALLALAEMPASAAAAAAVWAALTEPANLQDRWIPTAAIAAAAASDLEFLTAALQPGDAAVAENAAEDTQGAPTDAERAARDARARTVRIVAEHLARGEPGDRVTAIFTQLERAPGEWPAAVAAPLLEGLAAGWSGPPPAALAAEPARLAALVRVLPLAGQLHLSTLAEKWGLGDELAHLTVDVAAALAAQLADEAASDAQRLAAARHLAPLALTTERLDALLDALTPRTSPELATGVIESLSANRSPAVGTALVARWERLTPAARRPALAILLERPAWTTALLSAIQEGRITRGDLSVDQLGRLLAHPDEAIGRRAARLLARDGRLPDTDRQEVLDRLLPVADQSGDAALGRQVFDKNCAKCHRFGELGEAIGPDLTGIGVRRRSELLTDILDPSRSVEGNYRQYVLTTHDGRILTGLLLGESRTAVELLDSEARRHVVLRDEIDELVASDKSVMPEGFERLSPDELAGLLEFLAQPGRYLPLPLGQVATAVSTRGMFYDHAHVPERLVFDRWGLHTVAGVPFYVVDPRDDRVPNVVLLYGPQGGISRQMPRTVSVPCRTAARAIHLLGGISGWGWPLGREGSISLVVRLYYADGAIEDHSLANGVHLADYIRRVDVTGSEFAVAMLGGQQVRYLSIVPERPEVIERIELVKGDDETAPVVVAVTIERIE